MLDERLKKSLLENQAGIGLRASRLTIFHPVEPFGETCEGANQESTVNLTTRVMSEQNLGCFVEDLVTRRGLDCCKSCGAEMGVRIETEEAAFPTF